eukprot:TRINITY_DN46132_c0_g1_i1.p1 TRINITY_DN46132_c0_g1~~TRINITY_DN46132_c0_g1_i1.p1  ORF type:complete len:186 (+),score=32.69 TRINITY_DN46132_c0_g1_i1:43-600(+)
MRAFPSHVCIDMRREDSIGEERPQGKPNVQPVYSCDGALFSADRAKCRRIQDNARYSTPPPRVVDIDAPPPPLRVRARVSSVRRAALLRNSADEAREILELYGSLATVPFVVHVWASPLCSAERIGCSESRISLLPSHGASPIDAEVSGQSSAEVDSYIRKQFEMSATLGYGFRFGVDAFRQDSL